jgi:hypothetical protein
MEIIFLVLKLILKIMQELLLELLRDVATLTTTSKIISYYKHIIVLKYI